MRKLLSTINSKDTWNGNPTAMTFKRMRVHEIGFTSILSRSNESFAGGSRMSLGDVSYSYPHIGRP